MRSIRLFTSITIHICGIVLAASYFFPVEASWAPVDAWKGYWSSSGFMTGFDVASIEIGPFAVGLVVLIVFALLRWIKTVLALLITFTSLWISVGVWYVSRLFTMPDTGFRYLCLVFMILVVTAGVTYLIVYAVKSNQKRFVWAFLTVLAAASFLQQSLSIALYILEDKLLLNIGSVTGVAAAVGLFVSLFVRWQIQDMPGRQDG